MNPIKKLFKKYFSNFVYFYKILKTKIFISAGLSMAVSILDAFGLSMFLPLLQMVNDSSTVDPEAMGNLSFLLVGIEAMGIQLTLGFVLLFMLLFFLLKGIASYLSAVYYVILKQLFIKRIRLKLLRALNVMDFKRFITSNAGKIQNTMSGEVERVAQAYTSYFESFQQGVMVFVYMGFAFYVDIQFAILVSIGGTFTNILYKVIYKHTKVASGKLTFSSNTYQGQILQHVGNFKYLKATGMVEAHSDRLENTIYKIEAFRKRIGIWGSIGSAAREPLLITVVASVILVQVNLLGGELATILISLLFFYRALNSLAFMQQQWNEFMSVSGSLENMKDFQKEIELEQDKNGNLCFDKFTSSIVVENVNFSYGKVSILKNINVKIQKNKSLALIGESGSGKTTLVSLIAGLIPPDSGNVYVDNVPFKELDKLSYQKRIGYITQEPVIFNDTIFNNVSFWSEPSKENLQRFEKAIQQASIESYIQALPNGKETLLGNNGINLSGGQKQRISIARELYKDIDILIMDEATSALDSETEFAIQQSIEDLKGKYTLIIVAHRLSTIRNVDRLIFMDEGKIADEGTFHTLMEKYPRFRKMVALQEV